MVFKHKKSRLFLIESAQYVHIYLNKLQQLIHKTPFLSLREMFLSLT